MIILKYREKYGSHSDTTFTSITNFKHVNVEGV